VGERVGIEREPAMRMSTRRRALGSQPGRAVVWKMPTRTRTKSLGSVSERRSPLAMARLTFGCRKLFDFAAVDGFDEVVASWEVAIEGGVADAGSACDVVEARSCSIAGENFLGYLKDALAVALRVGAGFAGRRGW
jgi:hypothetical protein